MPVRCSSPVTENRTLRTNFLLVHKAKPATWGMTPTEVRTYSEAQNKFVLTFIGYSGAEYEHPGIFLSKAESILQKFETSKTIVNIGATPQGIGAVYELARARGFITTGIVSTKAKEHSLEISPFVDRVFFVEDDSWGGYVRGKSELSPTSSAMVDVSDLLVGIGGGELGRDELLEARRLGKKIEFYPADRQHQKARDHASERGSPPPTDFSGAASAAISGTDSTTRRSTPTKQF